MTQTKSVFITLFLSIFLAILPFICIDLIYKSYPKVPIEMTNDSMYYFTRSADIFRGHPFVGNPYVREHKDDVSPTFFVSDWVWSTPLFLGFSMVSSIFINQILWFVVTCLLLYWLFSLFCVPRKILWFFVAFVAVSTYWYIARPVAMQIIFPFFLGFIIALFYFIKDPKSWKKRIGLGVYSGFALYTYTYLAEIMAVVLIIMFLLSFITPFKKWRNGVFFSGVVSGLLSIPFLLYTWLQIHQAFYNETLVRLGLVHTHTVGAKGLIYFSLCALVCVAVFLWKKIFKPEEFYLLEILSVALAISVVSNIVTGIDLELAVHVARFIDLWLVILLLLFILRFKENNLNVNYKIRQKIVLAILSLPIIFIIFVNLFHQITGFVNIKTITSKEYYTLPLSWLSDSKISSNVVLADDSFSGYLPLMTGNYVVFNPYIGFQIMSDSEVLDRYLTSRMFDNLNLEQIKNDFQEYVGVGNAVHEANTINRGAKVCLGFQKVLTNLNCGSLVTSYSLKGDRYFIDILGRFDYIKKHKEELLDKYNVGYIIIDKQNDTWDTSSLKYFKKIK